MVTKNSDENSRSKSEERSSGLDLRLGGSDLVDDKANAALANDVRSRVTDLNHDNRVGATNVHHREQVHYRVGAPRNHGHDLRIADLGRDCGVLLLSGGGGKTDQQLVDDVQEEAHREEPAEPTRGQVASDGE